MTRQRWMVIGLGMLIILMLSVSVLGAADPTPSAESDDLIVASHCPEDAGWFRRLICGMDHWLDRELA